MTTSTHKKVPYNDLIDVVNKTPAPGWNGPTFRESNQAFDYPQPNLASVPTAGNLENIDKLMRQQRVLWPEFSWQTIVGDDKTRCFQMFAPDVSRLGYYNVPAEPKTEDEKKSGGRVYAIICPQQGAYLKEIGTFNVEVTVTAVRGWADEGEKKDCYADMSVVGTIWFGPVVHQFPLLKRLVDTMKEKYPNYKFPFSKADAIKVYTHIPGNKKQPLFPLKAGPTDTFTAPEFAQHWDDGAWSVANLEVEIGGVIPTGNKTVDKCNNLILDLFNAGKGNMLKKGNILTWNVWFEAPTLVDQKEWADHAEKWRLSIDSNHGDPEGPGTNPRFADGTEFTPEKFMAEEVADAVKNLFLFLVKLDSPKCIVA